MTVGRPASSAASCTSDCSHARNDLFCGAAQGTCVPSVYSTSTGPLVLWSCERYCDPTLPSPGCRPEYVCGQLYASQPTYGICDPKCTNAGFGACPGTSVCNATTGLCQ